MIALIMHAMSTIHAIKMQQSSAVLKQMEGLPLPPKAWSNLPLDLRIDEPFCFNFVTHAAKTDQRPKQPNG